MMGQEYMESLPLQAAFCGALLLSLLAYQLSWVLSSLLITSVYLSPSEQNSLGQFARKGLVGKFVGFLVLLATSALRLCSVFAQASVMLLYTFMPFVILGLVFMLLEQRWGDSAIMITGILNDPKSPLGETLRIVIKVPLQIMGLLAFYVLPAYNLVVYILFNLPIEFLVRFFWGSGGSHIASAVTSFAEMFPLLASSCAAYVQANRISCLVPEPTCWNTTLGSSTTCQMVDSASIAALCLDTQTRAFNFEPPLGKLRDATSDVLKGVAVGCGSLQTFMNIFLFPLTDSQVWKAIGSFLNALMYAFIGAPTTTMARCALAGGFASRPAMCTPDFGPSFDYAVDGLRSLGTAMDNFLDMAYLIMVYGPEYECPSSQANSLNLDLRADPIALSLFGSNTTVLVTTAGSSRQWVLTDGQNAVYLKYASEVRRSYFPNAWGQYGVNPRYGIAALQDGSMLGCSCLGYEGGIAVQCAIVTGPGQPLTAFNLSWELASSAQLLKCSAVRILVQSIRWPERRVLFAEQLGGIPASDALLAADAAVYVIPSCGGKASSLLACLDPAVLTIGNCFPFCMALHMTNAVPMVLRGYSSWNHGVLVTARDCVPPVVSTSPVLSQVSSSCSSDAASSNANVANAASASTSSHAMQCTYSSICNSWVSNKSSYSGGKDEHYSVSIPAFADTQVSVALVLEGQPLVAAGGVVMRLSKSIADHSHYIDFPMLTGWL